MRTLSANRACGILYRFLRQNRGRYLLPANVCPVVPLTFRLAEVDFDFVDINKENLCVDEEACLSLVKGGHYQGLVFVHTYGTQYDPQLFFRQLKSYMNGFHIVDDKCLCVPDFTIHRTEADLTLFSTGHAKYVDLGRGGFGYLQDGLDLSTEPLSYLGRAIEPIYKDAFTKGIKISHVPEGWLDAYVFDGISDAYRQCVECEADRMREHKKEINTIYREHLPAVRTLGDEFNSWRYNIIVDNKHDVLTRLFDVGLFASSHYQPSSGLFVDSFFPNAEWLYAHVINLFNDKYFTKEQALYAAKTIC